MIHDTVFPILDQLRGPDVDTVEDFGFIEPHIEPTDAWVALPVRLTYGGNTSLCIEIGPYTVSGADIDTLRAALSAYDRAVKP